MYLNISYYAQPLTKAVHETTVYYVENEKADTKFDTITSAWPSYNTGPQPTLNHMKSFNIVKELN